MKRVSGIALLLATAGCATLSSPSTQRLGGAAGSLAESREGRAAAFLLEARYGGIHEDSAATLRLEEIAARLMRACPQLPQEWRCHLLDTSARNAFSLPGRVYLTRALYEDLENSDLLAAALAHELAHLAHEDSLKPPCASDSEALEREMSADAAAARILRNSGFDEAAMRGLILLVGREQPDDWVRRRVQRLDTAVP
ncbi:MAG: M48 family metalloprotease [Phycisphaerales bacterium]|nr:M48 family metalloprotease [Phycisphaerales bacterium]